MPDDLESKLEELIKKIDVGVEAEQLRVEVERLRKITTKLEKENSCIKSSTDPKRFRNKTKNFFTKNSRKIIYGLIATGVAFGGYKSCNYLINPYRSEQVAAIHQLSQQFVNVYNEEETRESVSDYLSCFNGRSDLEINTAFYRFFRRSDNESGQRLSSIESLEILNIDFQFSVRTLNHILPGDAPLDMYNIQLAIDTTSSAGEQNHFLEWVNVGCEKYRCNFVVLRPETSSCPSYSNTQNFWNLL